MRLEPFTRDYFLSQLREMRELFGQRSFWKGDKPANAMRGLLYVYFNTDGLSENDLNLMEATAKEYDMRLSMVLGHGIYQPEKTESKGKNES
jgi:hypothetical protein